uniref:RING-type domain-containing protein n=1 Tax=Oncorhynchus kisutch TaxID=8019 RepID=A0A8C7F975_ONCKI
MPTRLSTDLVHCSICLDVFTNPVSIPCGHNFCRCCILDYWKTTALFQCPMCKKTFKRPDISINTVLREIAEQFKDIRVINAERLQQQELKEERDSLLIKLTYSDFHCACKSNFQKRSSVFVKYQ